jgi:hypothetical protein
VWNVGGRRQVGVVGKSAKSSRKAGRKSAALRNAPSRWKCNLGLQKRGIVKILLCRGREGDGGVVRGAVVPGCLADSQAAKACAAYISTPLPHVLDPPVPQLLLDRGSPSNNTTNRQPLPLPTLLRRQPSHSTVAAKQLSHHPHPPRRSGHCVLLGAQVVSASPEIPRSLIRSSS